MRELCAKYENLLGCFQPWIFWSVQNHSIEHSSLALFEASHKCPAAFSTKAVAPKKSAPKGPQNARCWGLRVVLAGCSRDIRLGS